MNANPRKHHDQVCLEVLKPDPQQEPQLCEHHSQEYVRSSVNGITAKRTGEGKGLKIW